MIKLKLHQFIAAEKDRIASASRDITAGYHAAQKPNLFIGLSKTYQPRLEDGQPLPGEKQLVQTTTKDVIATVGTAMAKLIDLAATKDEANQRAAAQVFVDGLPVTPGPLPLSTLLWLEKKLVDVRTFVQSLPVLPADTAWTFDDERGFYVSEPTQTIRQSNEPKFITIAPATDKHAAQVVKETEVVIHGTWTTERFSSAVSAGRKRLLIERVDKLIVAVKTARERANQVDITDADVGSTVMAYLFG